MPDSCLINPKKSPFTLFQEGQTEGVIALRPEAAGHFAFPPRLSAERELPTLEAARKVRSGVVYSATRIEARAGAYTLALVDLTGGGRLLARIRSEEAASLIGKTVTLAAERSETEPFLTFVPSGEVP